jgi:hypothetical protein
MSPIPGRIADTTQWQYWVIETVKRLEREHGCDARPIGMTMQFPVADVKRVNEPLFASPADWISPGFDEPMDPNADMSAGPPQGRWFTDPPEADGRKIILADTDHFSPMAADDLWPWKAFTRGQNPILYDLGIIGGVHPEDPSAGFPSYDSMEPARLALGDTRRLADRVDLASLAPASVISSTRFALANPGHEYVIFQPEGGPFDVRLAAGAYASEWFSLAGRTWMPGQRVVVEDVGQTTHDPQSGGPGVLHLVREA